MTLFKPDSFDKNLEKYAELTIRLGVNLQKNQILVIRAPLEAAEFVRKASKIAYEVGAKTVLVEYSDEELSKITLQHSSLEGLQWFPTWKAEGYVQMAEQNATFLTIYAPNPDLYQGIDAERISVSTRSRSTAMKSFTDYVMSSKVSWSLVSVPSNGWAQSVFPNVDTETAKERLWHLIFETTRVYHEDPIQAWKEHVQRIQEKARYLNELRLKKLHYRAEGTDLIIELPSEHIWVGAGEHTPSGVFFQPNIPTEEVFTMPLRQGVNGKVRSTKPLNYNGKLIENLQLTFQNGRIVDYTADVEYDALKSLIETDEGSHYLGEIALVPHNSPISKADVVFKNTLFDENASCHLAIGEAYPINIMGGADMTKEQLQAKGANMSLVHEDFMIGSENMNIDGETADGRTIPIFRNGNWA